MAGALKLAARAKDKRGGNDRRPDHFDRGAPDALGLWQDVYLESLAVRNYAPATLTTGATPSNSFSPGRRSAT